MQYKINWPEVGLCVVTAATMYVSVVCSHWAVALGVVLVFTLAECYRKRFLDRAERSRGTAPEDDGINRKGGG